MTIYDDFLVEGTYGVPLDIDQATVTADPAYDYDQLTLAGKDLNPHWTIGTPPVNVILNSIDYRDLVFPFQYSKNPDYRKDITFHFIDKMGDVLKDEYDNPLIPTEETIYDGVPINQVEGDTEYLNGLWQYTPHDFSLGFNKYALTGYTYTTTNSALGVTTPITYVELKTPVADDVYLIYDADTARATEKFQIFSGEEYQSPLDPANPSAIPAVPKDGDYIGVPLKVNGYVYRGYSIDGVDYPIEGYPNIPTDENYDPSFDPYRDWVPKITQISNDATVIYKYKQDTNRSGIADEETRMFRVSTEEKRRDYRSGWEKNKFKSNEL